jgi:polyisoprenoid-binding protein YceI
MKWAFATILVILSPAIFAADYAFDKVHTQITFTVSHLGFSQSTGSFVDFDGSFSFDENDFSKSSVEVTIKTKSIDFNDKKWNDHMKDKKWFDVKKYPTMVFKSTSVKKTGDKTMDVMGNLTLKGVTKPATLNVTFNKAGNAFGQDKVGFSAVTTIDRAEFGFKRGIPGIGGKIPVRIEVEGVKK